MPFRWISTVGVTLVGVILLDTTLHLCMVLLWQVYRIYTLVAALPKSVYLISLVQSARAMHKYKVSQIQPSQVALVQALSVWCIWWIPSTLHLCIYGAINKTLPLVYKHPSLVKINPNLISSCQTAPFSKRIKTLQWNFDCQKIGQDVSPH